MLKTILSALTNALKSVPAFFVDLLATPDDICSYYNPCQNGGSCYTNLETVYCICQGDYVGDSCETCKYIGMQGTSHIKVTWHFGWLRHLIPVLEQLLLCQGICSSMTVDPVVFYEHVLNKC